MKNTAKKICVFCCSGALMITSALMSVRNDGVSAGAGSGVNEKIETIDEISELLNSFEDQLTGFHAPVDKGGILSVSCGRLGVESEQDAGKQEEKTVYKSVTVSEASSWNVSYYSTSYGMEGNSSYESAKVKVKREMNVYISGDAVYYVSDFTAMSDYAFSKSGEDAHNDAHNIYSSMLMKIYLSNDIALLRFDRFQAVSDGEAVTGTEKMLGKWINMSAGEDADVQEAIGELFSVNEENFKVLALMGKYINKREGAFEKKNSVYTMRESTFQSFLSELLTVMGVGGTPDGNADGSFSVDLYDAEKPEIYFDLSNSYAGGKGSCSETDDFVFSNINNTVIGMPDIKNAITPAEFIEIIEEAMDA